MADNATATATADTAENAENVNTAENAENTAENTAEKKTRSKRSEFFDTVITVNGTDHKVRIPTANAAMDQIVDSFASVADVVPADHVLALKNAAVIKYRAENDRAAQSAKNAASLAFRDAATAESPLTADEQTAIIADILKIVRADGNTTENAQRFIGATMIRYGMLAIADSVGTPDNGECKIAGRIVRNADGTRTISLVKELKAPKAPSGDNASATPNNPNVTPDSALAPGNVNGNGSNAATDAATIPATSSPASQDRQDSHNPRERKHAGVK